MRTAHALWIVEVLASLAVLALVYDSVGDKHIYFAAEVALLAAALVATVLVGAPGKVLAVGIALGFALATLVAIGASSSCGENDFICPPGWWWFAFGMIVAGAFYPGWALGAGLGALARLETRRRQPRA